MLSLRGRRLKGKGKGALGKGFLGARETRGAHVVSHPNSLPLPFRTPATQATVAQRLVSAKPGLNFNLFLISFFFSKAFSPIIFSILFGAFNYQIVDERIESNLLFELLYLSSNFVLTPG